LDHVSGDILCVSILKIPWIGVHKRGLSKAMLLFETSSWVKGNEKLFENARSKWYSRPELEYNLDLLVEELEMLLVVLGLVSKLW
jgi:hypothetical protein